MSLDKDYMKMRAEQEGGRVSGLYLKATNMVESARELLRAGVLKRSHNDDYYYLKRTYWRALVIFWTLEILGFIWALPVTVLGLLLLLVSGGWMGTNRLVGLRFWFIPRCPWWWPKRFGAMCLGGISFVRFTDGYATIPPEGRTAIHEDEHRRQCWIFGPFMIIFYPLACLWALAYGKPYRANFFEIMARHVAGQRLEP